MTAVEWLLNEWPILQSQLPVRLVEEAISKEREQIVQAYSHGWHDGQDVIIKQVSHVDIGGDSAGDEYYNNMKGADL